MRLYNNITIHRVPSHFLLRLEREDQLDAPYWHIHPLHHPHSFLPSLPPGLWSYCCLEGCLWAPVAFTKAWTSSDALQDLLTWKTNDFALYNNNFRYLIPNFKSSSVIRKKFNALGTNNSYLPPFKRLFAFSRLSLDWIVNVIFQHCKAGGGNIVN